MGVAVGAPGGPQPDLGRGPRWCVDHDVDEEVVDDLAQCLLVGGVVGFFIPALALPAALIGFVLAMVNIFKKKPSPALILTYGFVEGIFLGGLSGERLIRVDLEGEGATEAENWPMGARIREVEEGPDGAIWLLQDGDGAKLLELRPADG